MMRDLEHNFLRVTKRSWILWILGLKEETCSLFQGNFLMDNGHKSSCYKSLGITFGIMKGIKCYFFHDHPISQIISQEFSTFMTM